MVNAYGETSLPNHDTTKVDLNRLQNNSLEAIKRASEQGICSPDFYDAGIAIRDLIFHKTSAEYESGNPDQVWGGNRGLQNYFNDLVRDYPTMSEDKTALIDHLRQLDLDFPIDKEGGHGPSLDTTAHYNAYEEALKITRGNVFRAVTLIGNLGHDDVSNLSNASNLYAKNSIGVSVPPDVVEKFTEAGKRCTDAFRNTDDRPCSGAGSSFNYHVNFGFYLGCYLARKGFGKTSVSKIFADGAITAFNDPYLEKELAEQERSGKLLNQKYQFDVCSDVPKLLGYFYKRTTMSRWLSDDAKVLFEKGYRRPFLERDRKNPIAKPADWNVDRWQKAVANLDYRLMHLEYGSKQSEAGAKKGAEVCSNYAAELKPKGLSPDAEALYKRGNFNPDKNLAELYRVPENLKASPEKLKQAWTELATALRAARSQFDYADSPIGTGNIDRHIEHLVLLHADKDAEQKFENSLDPNSLTLEVGKEKSTSLQNLRAGLRDLPSQEILAYLTRKAARTPLTNETQPDATRHGRLLFWAAKKDPDLRKKMIALIKDAPSDFLKYVSFAALTDLGESDELFDAATQLIGNAKEPLLSAALYVTMHRKISTATIKTFTARLESVEPRNLPTFGAKFLEVAPDDAKKELVARLISTYEKIPENRRNAILEMMQKNIPYEPSFRKLAITQLKSKDSKRLAIAMLILNSYRADLAEAKPELVELQKNSDPTIAAYANYLLSQLR